MCYPPRRGGRAYGRIFRATKSTCGDGLRSAAGDRLEVGQRKRSEFIQEAIELKLGRLRRVEAFERVVGWVSDNRIPKWEIRESTPEWRRAPSGPGGWQPIEATMAYVFRPGAGLEEGIDGY